MTAVLLIALIVAGVLIARRASARFSGWIGGIVGAQLDRRMDARLQRRRAEATAAGRPAGAPAVSGDRLRAGMTDLGGAAVLGFVLALAYGTSQVTSYYYDGTTTTSTSTDFSFMTFVLFTLAAYAGEGFRAARSDSGQTFGQRFFDYTSRPQDGSRPSIGEAMKRHMLRLVAGPPALLAASQGQAHTPRHDEWSGTTALTLA